MTTLFWIVVISITAFFVTLAVLSQIDNREEGTTIRTYDDAGHLVDTEYIPPK